MVVEEGLPNIGKFGKLPARIFRSPLQWIGNIVSFSILARFGQEDQEDILTGLSGPSPRGRLVEHPLEDQEDILTGLSGGHFALCQIANEPIRGRGGYWPHEPLENDNIHKIRKIGKKRLQKSGCLIRA